MVVSLTVFWAVDNASDGLRVLAQHSLRPCLQINPPREDGLVLQALYRVTPSSNSPDDLLVHSGCESLVVVRSKANIEYRRAVFKSPNKSRLLRAINNIVQVHVLVP